MRRPALIGFNIFLALVFLVLGARLWQMQVLEGGIYHNKAEGQRVRVLTEKAVRGVIYDHNGRQLVSNKPVYALAITPADLPTSKKARPNAADVFAYLSQLLQTKPVVAAVADDLPAERQAEVLARLGD